MKKKELVLFGLCFFILSSCSSISKVTQTFDESVPIEKSSWISPLLAGDIIGYNGIPVSWKNKAFSLQIIQIPAGDTLLEWNIEGGGYIGKNILFRFDFLPQKQYFFRPRQEDGVYGFNVYVYEFDEKIPNVGEPQNMKHLLGFFPFLNTNQGTILLHSP